MTPTPDLPPPAHRPKKAAYVVSFRPDAATSKALKAYCKEHGVTQGEAAEHLVRCALGLVK